MRTLLPAPGATSDGPHAGWVRGGLAVAVLGTLAEFTRRMAAVGAPGGPDLPYVEWWPDPSVAWTVVLWAAWLVHGLLYLTRRHRRVAGVVLALVFLAVLLTDRRWYSNHLYLLAVLVPLAAAADEDRGRLRLLPATVAKLQVSIVYLFAAASKMNPSFLSGDVLRTYAVPLLPDPAVAPALAWSVIAVEAFLALALWHRATRGAAFLLGAAFHLSLLVYGPERLGVAMFGLAMLSCYPLFACEAARPGR